MRTYIRFGFSLILALAFVFVLTAANKKIDPCAILTKAEIQSATGQTVGDAKPNPNLKPELGVSCTFTIASYGSLNLLIKPLGPSETPANIKAAFQKRNTKIAAAPNIGPDAFFLFPGYSMVQLFAFKGKDYALITLMIPGVKEDAAKAPAEKLMKLLLSRI